LEIQRRVILWMMDEHQMTAKEEIEKLDLGIDPRKIQCYKMSYQVGEWELLGGDVPDPTNPSNIHFQLGVLTGWLEKTQNSKEKELLILENIDKMDIGAISMLNNFWQDLKTGRLFANGREYRMPEKGMILLVAREEVNWSAA
jgi:hypothetical protein